MKLWDQMIEARHRAVEANEKMLHWAVNRAAIDTLRLDERLSRADTGGARLEKRTIYGIPFRIDETDRSHEPAFKLVTLESLDRK